MRCMAIWGLAVLVLVGAGCASSGVVRVGSDPADCGRAEFVSRAGGGMEVTSSRHGDAGAAKAEALALAIDGYASELRASQGARAAGATDQDLRDVAAAARAGESYYVEVYEVRPGGRQLYEATIVVRFGEQKAAARLEELARARREGDRARERERLADEARSGVPGGR